jgi:spore coat polysaccharide biosynthesis protein SpsF (cytidylyltransferase family)
MKALAIVQARMSSTRLPGKSLADVGGEPVLALLLRRLQQAEEVERIVLATTTDPSDDGIGVLGMELGCDVYRGSLEDVLGRFVGAADAYAGPLVRVTGDCPLIDPELVDEIVRLFRRTPNCDYASNIDPRSVPDGLDTEVFSPKALQWADERARHPAEREHVTTVMRQSSRALTIAAPASNEELGDLRWTLDTQDDLDFIRAVVERLGERRHTAGMSEILETVRNPPSLADFAGRRG